MMNTNTIEIEVPARGNAINIVLKDPWAGMNLDEVTIFENRVFPKCEWCECELEEADAEDDDFQEKWICPDCGDEHYFTRDMYGEDEITIPRDEWEAKCTLEYHRELLKKRYGTTHPKSIRDYWVKA